METNDLHEYLSLVVQAETDCFTLNELQKNVKNKIQNTLAPSKTNIAEPKRIDKDELNASTFGGAFLGAIIGSVVMLFSQCIADINHIEQIKIKRFEGLEVIVYLLLGAIIGSFFVGLLCRLINRVKQKLKYEKSVEEYNRKCCDENEMYAKKWNEYEITVKYFTKQLNELNMVLSSQNSIKDSLYNTGIIHQKYRDFVKIASIYEYIDTKRCDTLEGPNGAYEFFERDYRTDMIIVKLDNILQKMDMIINNQYCIVNELKKSNQLLHQIQNSNEEILDRLKTTVSNVAELEYRFEELHASSALNTYYSKLQQEELHYINRMNYFAAKYNNPAYELRRPPNSNLFI